MVFLTEVKGVIFSGRCFRYLAFLWCTLTVISGVTGLL